MAGGIGSSQLGLAGISPTGYRFLRSTCYLLVTVVCGVGYTGFGDGRDAESCLYAACTCSCSKEIWVDPRWPGHWGTLKDELRMYLKRGPLGQLLGEGRWPSQLEVAWFLLFASKKSLPEAQQCWVPGLPEGWMTQPFRPFEKQCMLSLLSFLSLVGS